MREHHGRVLWIVLAIYAVMFLVEGYAGLLAHSTSLLADALDMLGDALVYGFSLFVLSRSARWPDIVVGVIIAQLFLASSVKVLRQSREALSVPPNARSHPLRSK